jgi:hypothetical protein
VDGAVELLEDARIRPEQITPAQRYGGDPCDPVAAKSSPDFCETVKKALRPARVRLVSSDGRELSSLTLERPLATLDQVYLRSEVASYQVTVDFSIGWGSFAGPLTRFAEVTTGTFHWLRAVDAQTGKPVSVSVASTVKAGWKLSPTASGGKELLFDTSKPDAPVTASHTLVRCAVEDGRWLRYTRTGKGCWENDVPIPTRAVFP